MSGNRTKKYNGVAVRHEINNVPRVHYYMFPDTEYDFNEESDESLQDFIKACVQYPLYREFSQQKSEIMNRIINLEKSVGVPHMTKDEIKYIELACEDIDALIADHDAKTFMYDGLDTIYVDIRYNQPHRYHIKCDKKCYYITTSYGSSAAGTDWETTESACKFVDCQWFHRQKYKQYVRGYEYCGKLPESKYKFEALKEYLSRSQDQFDEYIKSSIFRDSSLQFKTIVIDEYNEMTKVLNEERVILYKMKSIVSEIRKLYAEIIAVETHKRYSTFNNDNIRTILESLVDRLMTDYPTKAKLILDTIPEELKKKDKKNVLRNQNLDSFTPLEHKITYPRGRKYPNRYEDEISKKDAGVYY